MATKETSNQEVSVALELLNSTLSEEKTRIYEAGVDAMKNQDRQMAQSVLDFATSLENFLSNVKNLAQKWEKLQEIRDSSTPAVQKIVTGEGKLFAIKPRKIAKGFTRKINHPLAAKSIFEVQFPDGITISESKACDTFIKSIEKIGTKRVFLLNLTSSQEALVSKTQSTKYPGASKETDNGYFILTHSSTKQKVSFLKKIAKSLKIKLKITILSTDKK